MGYLINRAESVTLKIVAAARRKPMIKSLFESLGVEEKKKLRAFGFYKAKELLSKNIITNINI